MASQRELQRLWSLLLILVSIAFTLQAAEYKPPFFSQKTLNIIDACWRLNSDWAANRTALSDCAIGFGKNATGGKHGAAYIVTDPSDNPISPKPGTLRYGVIQKEPLWIIFDKDMNITLKNELLMNSHKTIDGRGVRVEIANGPCIVIQHISNVIIHGISIHDCKSGKAGMVRDSPDHISRRDGSDGDGIRIFDSSHIWVDHCYLSNCKDGLLDVTHGSTAVTISNNYYSNHDKVMLFGHNDKFMGDTAMKVTVAFNYFGTGLVERMPRVRRGYAHVANNMYDKWLMYAIGGSGNSTILSEGNYFLAGDKKQVTKRPDPKGWRDWTWRSSRDQFVNGAYFIESGRGTAEPVYSTLESFPVADGFFAPNLTTDAGPLQCTTDKACL